jgi:predicted  nucleic acid-binding Zn-ribbon protein
MEEADKALKEERDAKAELKKVEAETEAKVAELQARKADLEKQHADGSVKRKALLDGIPEELLSLYEETRKRRAGIALAQVHNDTCTVCHMRVSPQCVINTRKGTKIEMCDSCQRILYDLETSQAKAG